MWPGLLGAEQGAPSDYKHSVREVEMNIFKLSPAAVHLSRHDSGLLLINRRRGRKKTHLQKPLLMENAAVCKFARRESMETACEARSDSTAGLLADSHEGTELWFHMVQHAA
ncbi:unnamed protein product [Pleuronectes platessa]|uniref:Uncharacterized protein n=1 Tax=Pleuronectes platessa TaxID=8262 RepID=A0A9N7TJM9_PLEPL|nr:unnamed protein product [Pleuronectes platessa]